MWMVVRTKPRAEKKVELLLNQLSLDEVTNPVVADALVIKVKHKWSDRTKIVEIPSISGYVFVRFATNLSLASKTRIINKICFTPGVLYFLTYHGKSRFQLEEFATISDRELEICRAAALESGDSIMVGDTTLDNTSTLVEPIELSLGEKVRFREGPLANLGATFIVEDINNDTPILYINEGIFKNAHFTVSRNLLEIVK